MTRLCCALAPVPLTIFRSNSKFDQNLQCSGLKCTLLITIIMKFCTRHDSVTVVTCAKFCCDYVEYALNWSTPKFGRISNLIKILFVGQAPGAIISMQVKGYMSCACTVSVTLPVTFLYNSVSLP